MRKFDPVNLKLIGSLFILVFLFTSIAITVKLTPQQRGGRSEAATQTVSFSAISSGGWATKAGSSYPPTSCSASAPTQFEVGQWLQDGTGYPYYVVMRSYIGFDTRSLPADTTINSATLKIKVGDDRTVKDFNLLVMRGNWGGGVECTDWGVGTTQDGVRSTAELPPTGSFFTIPISTSGINKGGYTYYELKSSREGVAPCCVDASHPRADEVLWNLAGSDLVLEVSYTTPESPQPQPYCGDHSCNGGETCSSCSQDCGSCPSTPGGGGGGTRPGGGTTTTPGILNFLHLQISVPYLIGERKIPVKIGSLSKEIEVSPDKKDYQLDVKEANLALNNSLTLVVGGNRTLIKKIQLAPSSETTAINVGDLVLGDITGDNKIDDKDVVSLLDSVAKQTLKGDLNADKVANSLDWAILLANFGKSGDF